MSTLNNLFADKLDIQELILAISDIDTAMLSSTTAASYYHFRRSILAAQGFSWKKLLVGFSK